MKKSEIPNDLKVKIYKEEIRKYYDWWKQYENLEIAKEIKPYTFEREFWKDDLKLSPEEDLLEFSEIKKIIEIESKKYVRDWYLTLLCDWEELNQRVLVNFQKIYDGFNPEKGYKFETYLKGAIKNIALKELRKQIVEKEIKEKEKIDILPIEEKIEKKLELGILKKKIQKLNPNYKKVISYYYLKDLSIKDIAKILKKSEGATRVLLSRALKKLKRELV